MRSSAPTTLAAIVLALAPAMTAAAQSGPAPEPTGAPDVDDAADESAAPAPAVPVSEPAAPSPAPEPAANPPDARDRPSFFGELELGVGGVIAGGSNVYGAGVGRGFAIGVRWRRTSIEWHFGQLYDAPVDAGLVATNTAGQVSISSIGLRLAPTPALSVYGGIAKASVPLLVRDSDTAVRAATIDGIGPTGGVALEWSSGTLRLGVELRLAQLVITDAIPANLTVSGPADASGRIPVTTDHAGMHPLIATLTATVRLTD